MPTYSFTCEICGTQCRRWAKDKPPRFCSRQCKGEAFIGRKKTKYSITPEMHEQIKYVYQTRTQTGEVKALAVKLGLPRWKISKYAQKQGWLPIIWKQPDWTEKELKILEGSARHTPEKIQKVLKKAGYSRSVTGIFLKRRRMRYLKNLNGQTARSVAKCFGVDDHCVTRWIQLGYLKAIKRGTKRTARQGGDQWYIRDKWIRNFIINCIDEIDIRKVDKYWFVDLLAGGDKGTGECKIQNDEDNEDFVDPEDLEIFEEAANY